MDPRLKQFSPLPYTLVPYVPPEIDLNDLHDNLCLLSASQLDEVARNIPVNVEGRFSKKDLLSRFGIELEYSILVHGGQRYIMYQGRKKNKQAGIGDFGVVKYAQHAESKVWYAIKNFVSNHYDYNGVEIKHHPDFVAKIATDEHAALQTFDLALGSLGVRASVSKGKQYYIVMRSAEGCDLFDYIEKVRSCLHPQHFIVVLKKICEEVDRVHRSGFIHRDIKQENMRFNIASGVVTLLDFGLMVVPRFDGTFYQGHIFGAKGKRAPEVLEGSYSLQSDIFATGATLADLLGFLRMQYGEFDKASLIPREKIDNLYGGSLFDKASKQKLYDICEEMMQPEKSSRLNLQAAIQKLTEVQLTMSCGQLTVAILDIKDYILADENRRSEIKKILTIHCHELVLTSSPSSTIPREALQLMWALQDMGLKVYNKIYHTQDVTLILNELKRLNPYAGWIRFIIPSQLARETVTEISRSSAKIAARQFQLFQPDEHGRRTQTVARSSHKHNCIML